MRKVLIILAFPIFCNAQITSFNYSKILTADSVTKNEIFDRALIWCSKNFKDSKSAINVSQKESGIIAGKANTLIPYKYPNKRGDSIPGVIYSQYFFDWTIQIKDGKLKFSISNTEIHFVDDVYEVTTSDVAPAKVMMLSKTRNNAEWQSSKSYFSTYLEILMFSLYKEINSETDF